MKKSDLIESWLNSEISEDEAILILERMKHDDSFTKEMVSSGEIHAALYTIFHEDNSFEELKLLEDSKSPEEIEDQIMQMIAAGEPKEKEKKKRITIIDLPQKITVKAKPIEKPKNYWPLFGAIAAMLVLVLSIAILTKKNEAPLTVEQNRSLSKDENISLVKDQKKKQVVIEDSPKPEEKTKVVKNLPEFKKPDIKAPLEEKKIAEMVKPEKKVELKEAVAEVKKTLEIGRIEGEAEYCSITRNGESIDAIAGIVLLSGDELSTSYESSVKVRLKDGSNIELATSSAVKFTEQKVNLLSGEALFNIAKQKEGQFQVFSGETTTTVVGTEFSINYNDSLSLVKVLGGVVRVKSQDHEVSLEKGQIAISRDGSQPQKRDYSQQFGLLASKWTADQIGPQVSVLEYDISDFITAKGFHDLYFKKMDADAKGMLQIFKVEFYENGELVATDEHHGVTSNHTTDLRNRNVWLHGGYGSSMYRLYLKKYSIKNRYTVKVKCRSFKGSCNGEIWLLSNQPVSQTLIPGFIPTGKNLAYRKKVSTEKDASTNNHGPEMIVDNKITPQSSWWGAGSTWVQIDLGKATEFNSMFIANFWEQNCYHQFFVEVSNDGQKWERVIDMTKNTLPAHESGQFHRFDSVKAQYVRMTVNGVKFSQGGISVVEVKIFDLRK